MDEHTITTIPTPTDHLSGRANDPVLAPAPDPVDDAHRLPEGPTAWRLDDVARQRGRAGIALARASLQAALERRARRQTSCDTEGADGTADRLELVA